MSCVRQDGLVTHILRGGAPRRTAVCHSVIDANVHFQRVARLAQRLVEPRKENWEVALYPVESHRSVEPASWADEYRRILKLFEDNLR